MTVLLSADPDGVARAAALLRVGELVAFGTETVYGLGADASNDAAVAAIFAAKTRPRFNPLICHYANADAPFADVQDNAAARRLAAAFWPGPLTLVLPRRAECRASLLASAGQDTLAVRVPSPDAARALLRAVDRPVAAPSANRSGRVSPTTAQHVLEELGGRIAAVLDSGPCAVGVESTVLDLTGAPTLLRPGGATREAIEEVIGKLQSGAHATRLPRSPGMLASHYAPVLPLRLNATRVEEDEALLAFAEPLAGAAMVANLSEQGNLDEAAARLFAALRQLDAEGLRHGLRRIAAMEVPSRGLGAAINDRLRRAAAGHGRPPHRPARLRTERG